MMRMAASSRTLPRDLGIQLRSVRSLALDQGKPPFHEYWKSTAHKELHALRSKCLSDGSGSCSIQQQSESLLGAIEDSGGLQAVPHVVIVHPVILNLQRVDELAQEVSASGLLLMKWYEPSLANVEGTNVEIPLPSTDISLPEFPRFSNAIGTPEIKEPRNVTLRRYPSSKAGEVTASWEWSARISITLGLRHFPFDLQHLRVVFWFPYPGVPKSKDYGRYIIPANCGEDAIFTTIQPLRSASAEWNLFEPSLTVWNQKRGKTLGRKQGLILSIPLMRKTGFYLNMLVIMGMIASLGFTAFAIPPANCGERLSATFSLLLALIAFKFSVAEKMPKVSYLTAFDLYMNAAIGLLSLLAIHHSNMKILCDRQEAEGKSRATGEGDGKVQEKDKEDKEVEPEPHWARMAVRRLTDDPVSHELYFSIPAFTVLWVSLNALFFYRFRYHRLQQMKRLGKEITFSRGQR